MKIEETILNQTLAKTLIKLSLEWQNEEISYGYRQNTIDDLKDKRIFIVKEKEEIIAYLLGHQKIQATTTSILEKDSPFFEIDELYVSKAYRSQGIGKQLMTFVENKLKQENIHHLQLTTSTKKYQSILHFYIEEMGMEFWSARLYKHI